MIVSAVLLFNEADNESLVDCSRLINKQIQGRIQLSDKCLPHLTLAQFEVKNSKEAELLIDEVSRLEPVEFVRSRGIAYHPSLRHNQLWIELGFERSSELIKLHESILTTSFAQNHEALSASGENFRPHCTLTLLEPAPSEVQKILVNISVAEGHEFRSLKLVAGVNGENFTFAKVLKRP